MRDVDQVVEEGLTHLIGLDGARVRMRLFIEAEFDAPPDTEIRRILTADCCALGFEPCGFDG